MTHDERLLEYAMNHLAEHIELGSVKLEMFEVFVEHPERFFSTAALTMSRMGWFHEKLVAVARAMGLQESKRKEWARARRKALVHMVEKLAHEGYLSLDAIASITGHSIADFILWLDEYEEQHGRYRKRSH